MHCFYHFFGVHVDFASLCVLFFISTGCKSVVVVVVVGVVVSPICADGNCRWTPNSLAQSIQFPLLRARSWAGKLKVSPAHLRVTIKCRAWDTRSRLLSGSPRRRSSLEKRRLSFFFFQSFSELSDQWGPSGGPHLEIT